MNLQRVHPMLRKLFCNAVQKFEGNRSAPHVDSKAPDRPRRIVPQHAGRNLSFCFLPKLSKRHTPPAHPTLRPRRNRNHARTLCFQIQFIPLVSKGLCPFFPVPGGLPEVQDDISFRGFFCIRQLLCRYILQQLSGKLRCKKLRRPLQLLVPVHDPDGTGCPAGGGRGGSDDGRGF